MKNTFQILFFIIFPFFASAQSISFYPSDTVSGTIYDNEFTQVEVKIFNLTSDSLLLNWSIKANTLADEWDYSICDFGKCYTGIPHNGTMQKMAASDTAFLKLTINAMSVSGVGYITFKISPAIGEEYFTTMIVNVLSTDIGEKNTFEKFNISPNPASGFISVIVNNNKNSKITFTNILGEIVKQEILLNEKNSISVSDLQEGIYFASIYSEGNIIETRKIVISR